MHGIHVRYATFPLSVENSDSNISRNISKRL